MARYSVGVSSRSFLFHFFQEHPDFRIQELESLASLIGCPIQYDANTYSLKNPFLVVQLPSNEVAKQIANRSFLLRSILELWGLGRNYAELQSSIEKNVSKEVMEQFSRTNYSYSISIGSYQKKVPMSRRKEIYERVSFLPFNGKVDLNQPDHSFNILEDYGDDARNVAEEPLRVFFGRVLGVGRRGLINQFSIKKRHFISNTTMDPQLAFLMANQAKVKDSDFVLDPFAGSGGVLLPCAYFGAHVIGADLDWSVVHGKGRSSRANAPKERGEDENACSNFRQYSLESKFIDMVVADAAHHPWKEKELFDAIVTDPPYGIREGMKKIGSKSDPKPVPKEYLDNHFPEQKQYKMSDLLVDLVRFAARLLVVGGRLVFWLPVVKTDLPCLPGHPCFRQISCSVQPLHSHVGRQLITMEKQLSWQQYVDTCSDGENCSVHSQKEKMTAHDDFRKRYHVAPS